MYRSIFVNEFNLDFHVPKKSRCDACEEVKTANKNGIVLSQERVLEHETHIIETTQMPKLRNEHRQAKDKLVITFDLENVINVPHAEISSFFYKRKLTLYNLTAHASLGKKGYCAIWTEIMSGTNGNDIASAFIRILREVVKDYPDHADVTVWSDSCVPQNRNQVIPFAVMNFIKAYDHLPAVTFHYSPSCRSLSLFTFLP